MACSYEMVGNFQWEKDLNLFHYEFVVAETYSTLFLVTWPFVGELVPRVP